MQLAIYSYTVTTALGPGRDALWRGLRDGRSGLARCDFEDADLATWIGRVADCEQTPLPQNMGDWDCRNNRLAELGLQQDGFTEAVAEAKRRYSPQRIGLFLGTSTSGIGATEAAYRQASNGQLPDWFQYQKTHEFFSVCGYVRARLGLEGPAMVISTACSSSAKVFASAARSMDAGFCDAAIVGGVDSLCLTTLYGFHSLQLVAAEPCRPCDLHRQGISIGEAAGFALVTPAVDNGDGPAVLGWGESCDAYHMSSPDPAGKGAELAMRQALQQAELAATEIDAVNLHGTATPANDRAECRAIGRLLGREIPAASTKGWTGHTLGAAGIVEAAIGWLCIEHDWLPQTLNTRTVDPDIEANISLAPHIRPVHRILSNSFGFGGSNCSLLLGWRP
jgi:3-oxoacyl-[acyl-carrier-protein] synthase-1